MFNGKTTVRVYGLLINEQNKILVTDEIFNEKQLIKFPGGGLEYGEGTRDCLKRECMEEMGVEVDVQDHFYTSDFFIPSIFQNDFQVICIYYFISTAHISKLKVNTKPFDFVEKTNGSVVFRWVDIKDLLKEKFTFNNDQIVAKMLYNQK